MLFAVTDAETTSWFALGVAVVTMIGGVLHSFFQSRDKKNDKDQAVKVDRMARRQKVFRKVISRLKGEHRKCEENHAATEKKLEKCEEGHRENDRRLSALEAVITPTSTPIPDELKVKHEEANRAPD